MTDELDLGIAALGAAYRSGALTPRQVVATVQARMARTRSHNIWITTCDPAALAGWLARLDAIAPDALPLYGIPFAIKDNIDLAQVRTTAGCPAFAYTPTTSAFVVERLIAAGAIPLGKTNLDQFATGLVGTRSPYGATANAFDRRYISGGSSSGSAVAVALGQASFALGTDTAGSGRVPAALNNLVGIKPTRGAISTRGVVPACRSLDCVSVFALDFRDAAAVMRVASAYDEDDPWARASSPDPALSERFAFGIPDRLDARTGDEDRRLFAATVERLAALGGEPRPIAFAPFAAAARLLYEGPWVAERYAAIRPFVEMRANELHPITRAVIEPAATLSAVDYCAASDTLARLRLECARLLAGLACLVCPTVPAHPTQAEVAADPIGRNSLLGTYTNFMNLLDLAAVAVPAGRRANGLPWGVTLCGPAGSDSSLAVLGARLHRASALPRGALGLPATAFDDDAARWSPDIPGIALAVCGAHMSGLALNHQLATRGARLLARTTTAPCYRLYALPGEPPSRPGLVRQGQGGAAIEVEVWQLPAAALGDFVAGIPAPLAIGSVQLADGSAVHGFVCESFGCDGAEDITRHGGWRAYLAAI